MNSNQIYNLLDKLATTPVKFKDSYSETFFMARPVDIYRAEAQVNEVLHDDMELSAIEYFDILGASNNVNDIESYDGAAWGVDCLCEVGVGSLKFDYDFVPMPNPADSYFNIILNCYPCDAWAHCRGGCM